MKKAVGIILVSLVFLNLADAADESGNVQATIDRWVKMWNTYDLREVGGLFCHCDELSYFSSEREGLIRGIDAVIEHHRGFGFQPGESDRGTKLWLEDVTTSDFGETSLVTAIWYFERPERTQKGPVTILLRQKPSGGYEIVHMNFSNYQVR